MRTMTIRNLPDDVHRRLRHYAAEHGISTEAAVRRLLDEATRPVERVGDVVAAYSLARSADFPVLQRDNAPIDLADFS